MAYYTRDVVLAALALLMSLRENATLFMAFLAYDINTMTRHDEHGRPIWTPFTSTIANPDAYRQIVNDCCDLFGVDHKNNDAVAMCARNIHAGERFGINDVLSWDNRNRNNSQ